MARGGEERREGEERSRGGDDDHGGAGVGEGPQEVQGEDEERGQRRGHGEGGEGDGAPGGLDGPDDRVIDSLSGGELFPEAADDEQRIVDGESETERGGEVDGVDRYVGDLGDQVQG